METVQQNGSFSLFSSKFHSNIYSILYEYSSKVRLTANEKNYRNSEKNLV